MRGFINLIAFALVAIIGCSDYALHPQKQEIPVLEVPNIRVVPSELNFGHLDAGAGESKTQVLTITNIGNATLNLSAVHLGTSDLVYSVSALTHTSLKPDAATRVIVTYIPRTHELNANSVIVGSDDPNDAQVEVPITGQSSAPVIQIDPINYDFGVTYIGCYAETTVNIKNIGDSDLIISDIQYFVSYPPELSIEIDSTTYGPFPWTLEAGDSRRATIYHEPWDLQEDSGFIEAHSNDPVTPVAVSNQEAMGDYYSWASDFYEQEEVANADILFVIDNSCSMNSHQTNLKNNGIYGSGLERGLWESHEATQSGGDAAPGGSFLRTDSRLVIIYLSDERDGSATYSSMTPTDYANHLLTLKPLADQLSVNAVAGDHPNGCSPPYGYLGSRFYFTKCF